MPESRLYLPMMFNKATIACLPFLVYLFGIAVGYHASAESPISGFNTHFEYQPGNFSYVSCTFDTCISICTRTTWLRGSNTVAYNKCPDRLVTYGCFDASLSMGNSYNVTIASHSQRLLACQNSQSMFWHAVLFGSQAV